MTQDELNKSIEAHAAWLRGAADGNRADLTGADLTGAILTGAILTGAILNDSDLTGANLTGANLAFAKLAGANLTGARLVVVQCGCWTAYVQPDHIRIGCQYHAAAAWFAFSDDEISEMHGHALEWWRQWRPVIEAAHRAVSQ